jgi:hypothetical protein
MLADDEGLEFVAGQYIFQTEQMWPLVVHILPAVHDEASNVEKFRGPFKEANANQATGKGADVAMSNKVDEIFYVISGNQGSAPVRKIESKLGVVSQ